MSGGKRCGRCDADISHLTYKHRYCEACKRHRVARAIRTRQCKICLADFNYTVSRGTDKIYCSKPCRKTAANQKLRLLLSTMPLCSISDCSTRSRSRNAGYCERHYGMVRRNGAPILKPKTTPQRTPRILHPCPVCDSALQPHSRKGTIYCSGDCKWTANTARRYGLDVAECRGLLAGQDNGCAICQTQGRRLVVDHDHKSGAVRGLLCGPCNSGLGMLQDSPVILAGAIDYLARGRRSVTVA